ncbi:MAG: hypothetical protein HC838_07230, partial [Spirulinaceae cyanobacterium RM2_2_10]|nr:hypothetical protein [Spirulinaceae cyanobacterium RM2_2_10]
IPGATVRLTPARQRVEATVAVTVNTSPGFTQVDVDNAVIPAIRLTTTLEDTAVIPTTGQRDLGAERARGHRRVELRLQREFRPAPGAGRGSGGRGLHTRLSPAWPACRRRGVRRRGPT